ncbi:Hsp20/alpha crystallin family protein [Bacillus sp. ISL-47]|uniref:Hsp20/alpha crystallin family protein n=1 Tax=Bacillus sp. ISL-47 TaxID=2819130 RepID=UPI001BE5C268|nr:Hsp20/alpha crystallin family protein [Bacillus sp. ISL-47]MBT2689631.1 Hsp20/alpha crystallin family protein [Bacillus sp. ISL-47]MBT2708450.1 Hsp20/alpha crystallin family protein [Pseudomonas sp. ISL-84]
MNKKDDLHRFNLSEMEKWMENFFLDPLTSYMDQLTFRIDLYDTENEIIVEALLTGCVPKDVTVSLKENKVIIKAVKKELPLGKNGQPCMRKVELPFKVINKRVRAAFSNGILEIFIAKNEPGSGCDRNIMIP